MRERTQAGVNATKQTACRCDCCRCIRIASAECAAAKYLRVKEEAQCGVLPMTANKTMQKCCCAALLLVTSSCCKMFASAGKHSFEEANLWVE